MKKGAKIFIMNDYKQSTPNNPFSGSYVYAVRDIHQQLLSSLPCLIVTSHHQHTLVFVYKSCVSVKIYRYVEEIQSQIKKLQLT